MRIVMMACTQRGFAVMQRAASGLQNAYPGAEILQTGRCSSVPGFENGPGLSESTARWFENTDALVYFAATGIAVRCIAPFVRDKFRDPAVLAVDENGRFAISLLSGHAGGANRLCGQLAEVLGAQPVITTATDGRGLFAVDVFAVEKGLKISDRILAKRISARLLAGETVEIFFDGDAAEAADADAAGKDRQTGKPGKGTVRSQNKCLNPEKYGSGVRVTTDRRRADIIVSYRKIPGDTLDWEDSEDTPTAGNPEIRTVPGTPEDRPEPLYLIPPSIAVGIGCRKGTPEDRIRGAVEEALERTGIFRQAVCGIASIDLKSGEPGLHAFAEEWGLPLAFYTADQLSEVPGSFSRSDFVRSVTGVDCVCERSAMRLAGPGAGLILPKYSSGGVTVALAQAGKETGVRPLPPQRTRDRDKGKETGVRPLPPQQNRDRDK